jgi:hypothetical protein
MVAAVVGAAGGVIAGAGCDGLLQPTNQQAKPAVKQNKSKRRKLKLLENPAFRRVVEYQNPVEWCQAAGLIV